MEKNGMTSGGLAIEALGLVKSFGSLRVLAGVDLRVTSGSVYSLLGPNGTGKTTTVRILATLLPPDAGRSWPGPTSFAIEGGSVVRSAVV